MADKRSNTTQPSKTNQNSSQFLPVLDSGSHSDKITKKQRKEIHDDFCCRCSLCRNYYKTSVPEDLAKLIVVPPSKRTEGTYSITRQKLPLQRIHTLWIKIGDRVLVQGKHTGTVKYIGPLDDDLVAPDVYVGVQLDDGIGLHDGIYKGKRYFNTPRRHGIMVKYKHVQKIRPATKRPAVTGNTMFPSYDTARRRRSKSASDPGSETTVELRYNNHGRSSTAPSSRVHRVHLVEPRDSQQDSKRRQQGHRLGELSSQQVRKIAKWREEFGNDDRASRMASMLKRLYLAKEKGKEEVRKEEEEKEKEEKLDETAAKDVT